MMKFTFFHLLLVLHIFWQGADARDLKAAAQGNQYGNSTVVRQDAIIVQYKVSAEFPADKPRYRIMRINPRTETVQQAIERFQQDPRVEVAEPDYVITVDQTTTPLSYATTGTRTWGQRKISATGGWSSVYTATLGGGTYSGTRVSVCVVDSGIDYNHNQLKPNMHVGALGKGVNMIRCNADADGNVPSACVSAYPGLDDSNHGTHCAGIIAGVGNISGGGVPGVSYASAALVPCKFLDRRGSGYLSDAIQCISWCNKVGAKLISNSWGGGGFVQSLKDEIVRVGIDGALLVFAAGNDGVNIETNNKYPASFNLGNMVNVASTDSADARSSFSNYGGTSVHIAAPGSSIYSTITKNSYATYSGTSMACPFVTGTLALMKAKSSSRSWDQLRSSLLSSGWDAVSSGTAVTQSAGAGNFKRLNVAAAVTAA